MKNQKELNLGQLIKDYNKSLKLLKEAINEIEFSFKISKEANDLETIQELINIINDLVKTNDININKNE